MLLIQSVVYATQKHEGQNRIGGLPYISHPLAVAEMLEKKGYEDVRFLKTALFHDLLEDTDATEEEIYYYGGKEVLSAVKTLTKTKDYKMNEYIFAIKNNQIAKMVKLADRIHNLKSAIIASESFKAQYIKETEMYYVDLAKNSIFEDDLMVALNFLKADVK